MRLEVDAARRSPHTLAGDRNDLVASADGSRAVRNSLPNQTLGAVRDQASMDLADVYADGATTCVCAVHDDRAGVPMIMSDGADFGSRLVLTEHGNYLDNGRMRFSLQPGDHMSGHARPIRVTDDGLFCGAADRRSGDGACVGR